VHNASPWKRISRTFRDEAIEPSVWWPWAPSTQHQHPTHHHLDGPHQCQGVLSGVDPSREILARVNDTQIRGRLFNVRLALGLSATLPRIRLSRGSGLAGILKKLQQRLPFDKLIRDKSIPVNSATYQLCHVNAAKINFKPGASLMRKCQQTQQVPGRTSLQRSVN